MTDPLAELPFVCRDLLEETPGDGRACPNKPKVVVTEADGTLSYACIVHRQEALDDGLTVRPISEVAPG